MPHGPEFAAEGVGPFIERRRKELGLTQSEVARRIGMSETQLSHTIRQRRPDYMPALPLAERLAEALECSVYDLMRAAGWPDPRAADEDEDPAAQLRRLTAEFEALPIGEPAKAILRGVVQMAEQELRATGPKRT